MVQYEVSIKGLYTYHFFSSQPAAATAEKLKFKRLTGWQLAPAPRWCISPMHHHSAAGMWQCRTPAHSPLTAKQLEGYRVLILHPTMASVIFLSSKMHTCKPYWEANTSKWNCCYSDLQVHQIYSSEMFILKAKEQIWPGFSSLLILITGLWLFGFKKTNLFWRKNVPWVGFVLFPPYFWSEIQLSAHGDRLALLPSRRSCEIRTGLVLFFLLLINTYATCVLRHTCSATLILHWSHQWKSEHAEELERCHWTHPGISPRISASQRSYQSPLCLKMMDDILTHWKVIGSLWGSDFLQSILSSVIQEKN